VKKIITKKNINDYLIEDEKEFYVDNSMIISPGVKDILRNKGIVIIYGNRKENCSKNSAVCKEVTSLDEEEKSDGKLRITRAITSLLTQEFKITDAEMIEEITSRVLNRIEK